MMPEAMVGIGSTDDRSVRIWLRCPEYEGELELDLEAEEGEEGRTVRFEQRGHEGTDWTMSVKYPDDFDEAAALTPATRYRFRISTVHDRIGEGRFETAPDSREASADSFAFAFMSCHQPFGHDGEVLPEAKSMLEILGPTLERHRVKYVLFIGDQMYSDYPAEMSLFEEEHFRRVARHGEDSILDCDEEEILYHFHRRYRKAWANEPFRGIQRHFPTYWILDDHEIVDNWGAAEAHSEPRWQRLGRAARRAFLHYQASHAMPADRDPPDSFHQQLQWGDSATFITDMRSARAVGGPPDRIFSERQFDEIERFLESNHDRAVLFLVLTVPIMPLPKALIQAVGGLTADDSDVDDRWEASVRVEDRDRFLRILYEHRKRFPDQEIVLLSGDVHLGCALEVGWRDEDVPPFVQLVSSGVTNVLGLVDSTLVKGVAELLPMMEIEGLRLEANFVEGVDGENPVSGLNFGIVEVLREPEGPKIRFRILTNPEDEGDGEAVVAFDSGSL